MAERDIPPENQSGPKSLGDLFWSFSWLAVQGFGGVMAIAQRELVERKRWLTKADFLEEWSVAQTMPGPNVMNLSLVIGGRRFGWRGALAAMAGMLGLPLLVVLGLILAHGQIGQHPVVMRAMRGMGAVAAGLILAAGLRLGEGLKGHPLGWPACLGLAGAAFAGVALRHWPLPLILFGLGGLACLATYRRLEP
ncbi:chromate transporter [Geothrix sp. 21YS21S-4]|uniref:chromate transporter n=1 Tax=Geothrix sp. 21YS21S-4 TaxID=3068889 RepID=UPI0027B99598|nr:chromate transporter [Geothrix sp. 21YS21S-4]